jgi:hypothetical protein
MENWGISLDPETFPQVETCGRNRNVIATMRIRCGRLRGEDDNNRPTGGSWRCGYGSCRSLALPTSRPPGDEAAGIARGVVP